ncbi:MAG: hypothetical protein GXY32_08525 [Ruminococcaceae bacterium]|nr:hypothetical protein [Oscillospiraceae bacterium]
MELYLKQKVFSLKGRFNVYDVNENPLYTVEGKVFSLHRKHFICDRAGKQVAAIAKKPVSVMPRFFYRAGRRQNLRNERQAGLCARGVRD